MSEHKVIQTASGQTVVGKVKEETDTTLTLDNPVILHFQMDGPNVKYQPFPLFFMELIDVDSRDKNSWTYTKANITLSDVVLAKDIIEKCDAINTVPEAKKEAKSPKIVSIKDL